MNNQGKISKFFYKIFRKLVKIFYHKMKIEGLENLPNDAGIIVGNHTQMNGPICAEIYFPGKKAIWCAYQMMYLKEVPAYAYANFWSGKPKYIKWFYKILSYLIAPISCCVFNNANTIPVFHDNRVIKTFRSTVDAVNKGKNVIIFPENYEPYNNIVNNFQDRFIDIAKLYYKKTGKEMYFTPLYIAPNLKKMYLGKPVKFNSLTPIEEERTRIAKYLMEAITEIAVNLPVHKVVPYANIPKKLYKNNIPLERANEETCS